MKLSLIVCTRNRAPQLAEALAYFSSLLFLPEFEFIIVDNGSTDATNEVIASFAKTSKMPLRCINEPRRGLSVARNAGFREATGSILVFTDDDCYPQPDYLTSIVTCFDERPIGYLGGRVLLWDRNDLPFTIQPLDKRVDLAPRTFIRPGFIHGANMAFKRCVLEAVGPFDELLGAGTALHCAEDADLLLRASAGGFEGAYDPRPTVFHHHRRSGQRDAEALLASYDIGRGALYAKALLSTATRRTCMWPCLRRILGNLFRLDFKVLRRELHGAFGYIGARIRSAHSS